MVRMKHGWVPLLSEIQTDTVGVGLFLGASIVSVECGISLRPGCSVGPRCTPFTSLYERCGGLST